MNTPRSSIPIVCDMTNATDTAGERLAEYARLFDTALVGRERTESGIRFRFRTQDGADDDLEAWVRDLAAREASCCAFFSFVVTREAETVIWDASVVDDELARVILEEFYALPVNGRLGANTSEVPGER